jgi:hypothetical protein
VLLNESLRGGVAPGREQGLPDGQLVGVAQADDGAAAAVPRQLFAAILGRIGRLRLACASG